MLLSSAMPRHMHKVSSIWACPGDPSPARAASAVLVPYSIAVLPSRPSTIHWTLKPSVTQSGVPQSLGPSVSYFDPRPHWPQYLEVEVGYGPMAPLVVVTNVSRECTRRSHPPSIPGRPEMGQEHIRGACSKEHGAWSAAAVPNNGAREAASSTTTPEAFARTT